MQYINFLSLIVCGHGKDFYNQIHVWTVITGGYSLKYYDNHFKKIDKPNTIIIDKY